jgi:tetraacyldisaccharide 4'-kinase
MVIEIARRIARDGGRPAVLLRGYRSGDEAFVLRDALGDSAEVEPDPDRISAAERVWQRAPGITAFVLDDGFQHRQVRRALDLVLVDATNPWGFGRLLPRGLLREPKRNLRRADAVIVSRAQGPTPELDREIAELSGRPPIAHTHPIWSGWRVAQDRSEGAGFPCDLTAPADALRQSRVYALCGIGNPTAFEAQLRQHVGELVGFRAWGDHHDFSYEEALTVYANAAAANATAVVMTEKDWVKWRHIIQSRTAKSLAAGAQAAELRVYRPVLELKFLDGSNTLDALLWRALDRPGSTRVAT